MIDLAGVSFSEFRRYVFLENEKYHPSSPYAGSAGGILRHSIRLFEESGDLLRLFPKDLVFQGLDFLSGAKGFFAIPADPTAAWDLRENFYLSMVALFRDLFSVDPMDFLAFMWFERMMVWSRDCEQRATLDDARLRRAMLAAMQGILGLDSLHCRQAALHGLNHIHREEPVAAERIIDGFLEKESGIGEELYRYAKSCRVGRDP